jgi:AraC-like DNA-binding protein
MAATVSLTTGRADMDDGCHQSIMWRHDGITIVDDGTLALPRSWQFLRNHGCGLGLARAGAYRRASRGVEQIVDTNTGFLRFDGEEVGVAGVGAHHNEITFITVDPERHDIVAEMGSPSSDFTVTPQIDLLHRQLLRAQRRPGDTLTVESLSLALLSTAVAQKDARVRSYSRRTTASAHRRLVADACEALHNGSERMGLLALAKSVGCSPFHLSRVFRDVTGLTIPQYRNRLRVHDAMDRLADGADDLASIAAKSGFADHSHMTRSIVAQYGSPPSRLRELLLSAEMEMLRIRR